MNNPLVRTVLAWICLCVLSASLSLVGMSPLWDEFRWPGAKEGAAANEIEDWRRRVEGFAHVETVAKFPQGGFVFDPAVRDRLLAFGSESRDGGLTWAALKGRRGERVVSLKGPRTTPPVVREGRLVLAEALIDEPGIDFGRGPIAHAAVFNSGEWTVLLGERPEDVATPALPVRSAGFLPSGEAFYVIEEDLIAEKSRIEIPGPHQALFASAGDGSLWVGTAAGAGRFPLYRLGSQSEGWAPVEVPAKFEAKVVAEAAGVTLVGGRSLLVASPSGWIEKPWPTGFLPAEMAGHPKARWIAAWQAGVLVVGSLDGPLRRCRLENFVVTWAAFDPFRTDSITVTDAEGNAARLSLASIR